MLRSVITMAAFSSWFLSVEAKAEIVGADLYQWCSAAKNSRENDVCTAFILGVLKGMDYVAMQFTKKPCFADYVPPVQAEVVVKKFMNDHPEWLNYDAGVVATMALTAALGKCQPK
jgi:hypothetical protein